jgi:hypothetical protein
MTKSLDLNDDILNVIGDSVKKIIMKEYKKYVKDM